MHKRERLALQLSSPLLDVFVTKMNLISKFKFKIGHLTNSVISVEIRG